MAGSRRQVKIQRVARYHSRRGAADRHQARSGNRRARPHRAVAEPGTNDQAGHEGVAPDLGGAERRPCAATQAASPPITRRRGVGNCSSSIPTWFRNCVAPVPMVLSLFGSRTCRRSSSSCLRYSWRDTGGDRDHSRAGHGQSGRTGSLVGQGLGFLRCTAHGCAHLPGVGEAHAREVRHHHRGRHDRREGHRSQTHGGHQERTRL